MHALFYIFLFSIYMVCLFVFHYSEEIGWEILLWHLISHNYGGYFRLDSHRYLVIDTKNLKEYLSDEDACTSHKYVCKKLIFVKQKFTMFILHNIKI